MYNLPKKIDSIVQGDEDKVRAALQENQGGCPLYRSDAVVVRRRRLLSDIDYLENMLSGLDVCHPVESVAIPGCLALRDPHCYLQRASKKHPQVERKEECPIYQRTMELLG